MKIVIKDFLIWFLFFYAAVIVGDYSSGLDFTALQKEGIALIVFMPMFVYLVMLFLKWTKLFQNKYPDVKVLYFVATIITIGVIGNILAFIFKVISN